ncbi:hypothetical protein VTH06DRAFT_611 [Thermothelomyces fergusii]
MLPPASPHRDKGWKSGSGQSGYGLEWHSGGLLSFYGVSAVLHGILGNGGGYQIMLHVCTNISVWGSGWPVLFAFLLSKKQRNGVLATSVDSFSVTLLFCI